MTVHMNVWGTRPTMHMHAWADGGGSYGSVIELFGDDVNARVTLIGDTVDTYPARRIDADADTIRNMTEEFAMTEDYAGSYASDFPDAAIYSLTDDDYVIVSHGIMFALNMFGTTEDN